MLLDRNLAQRKAAWGCERGARQVQGCGECAERLQNVWLSLGLSQAARVPTASLPALRLHRFLADHRDSVVWRHVRDAGDFPGSMRAPFRG